MSQENNNENLTAIAILAAAAMRANPAMSLTAAVRDARAALGVHGGVTPQQIADSVRPDKIKCLEDGTWHVMLRRYLARRYNMTPAQYREKWGLPHDYPFVAPDYARRRSGIAKNAGLGRK